MIGLEYLLEVSLQHYIFLGLFVFCIGILILLIKKNSAVILMGAVLVFSGINIIAVSFSHYTNSIKGNFLTVFILTLMILEICLGLILLKNSSFTKEKESNLFVSEKFREDNDIQLYSSFFVITLTIFIILIFFK